jgi:anthranilate synthase component 1
MNEVPNSGGRKFAPELSSFQKLYKKGQSQVVWARLVADLETPVSAFLKLTERCPQNSFLFESVEGGAVRGRYSAIGLKPDLIFQSNGEQAEINENCIEGQSDFTPLAPPTLDAMRELLERSKIDLPDELPPMSAGVFGYMAYDTVRLMEHLPDVNEDVLGVPDSIFVRPTIMVIFDAVKDEMVMVHRVDVKEGVPAKKAYLAAVENLKSAILDLNAPVPHMHEFDVDEEDGSLVFEEPSSNTSPKKYKEMVKRAQDYITEGDIFQVVLSQRFTAPFSLPPFSLYRALRRTNPSPFLYYLNFTDFSVIGSSPEILVRARDEVVTVRPIAGTRPRGETEAEDIALGEDLLADPKECAEHLMLLDLGRNDVGRVSKTGSVTVTDQFFLERYSHVMHIVSNVEGKLAPEFDEIDALMAGFPAGTVSGAPKVRAMEIIDELEVHKRGVYAGCVGYFSATGEMDSCIVLRTAIVKDGEMHVQAGAGIVADSVPQSEFDECVNKAKALFSARAEALRFAGIKRNN